MEANWDFFLALENLIIFNVEIFKTTLNIYRMENQCNMLILINNKRLI